MQRDTFFSRLTPVLMALPALLCAGRIEASTLVKLVPQDALPASGAALAIASSEALPEGWKYLPALDLYVVDDLGQDRLDRLYEEGAVAESEEEFDIQLEALPNDPMSDVQGWITDSYVDIGAPGAWDFSTGDEGVIVAVIDTGLSYDHPDLAPNLWVNEGEIAGNGKDDDGNGYVDDVYGYDFWAENGDVTDDNNHGSHLAGIIGAAGDNGIGVAGINWHVRIMPLKFTDANGAGTSALAIEAIDYAIRHGARVINASWTLKLGSTVAGSEWQSSNLLRQAIERAGDAGILFVTAAGNQFRTYQGLNIDEDPVYPASFDTDNMMTVAALDSEGALAGYSNYGPFTVDLAAPGSGIYSTGAHGGYAVMSGTSIAAAFVSGAAALILAENPELEWPDVKAILEEAAEGESSLNGKVGTQGYLSLLNAMAALEGVDLPNSAASASSSPPVTANPLPTRAVVAPASGCSLRK